MAFQGKLVCKFSNTSVSGDNYQLVDFDFSAPSGTMEQCAAGVIAYLVMVGLATGVIAEGTSLVEITKRTSADPGAVPIAFPTDEWDALIAATDPPMVIVEAFPVGVGAGGPLCPLGTSISVSEYTAHAGPTGRGRHFLPFTGEDAVNGGGQFGATPAGDVKMYYDRYVRGDTISVDLNPVVRSADLTDVGFPITVVKPQPVFSNLESRRR